MNKKVNNNNPQKVQKVSCANLINNKIDHSQVTEIGKASNLTQGRSGTGTESRYLYRW